MRRHLRPGAFGATCLSLAVSLTLAAPAAGQPAFGVATVTGQQRLVAFETQTPGTITSSLAITGLQGAEVIHGLDFDPCSDPPTLFALGSTSRLYTIDTSSGAATQVGSGAFTPALSGTRFGFDIVDCEQARVVSDADQSLRVDLGTGAATADPPLAYDSGDANFGANPNVVGAAQAPFQTEFGIDSVLDVVVVQRTGDDPLSDSALTTVGPLGVDTGPVVGFDITGGLNPYAALDVGGQSRLYLLDLESGAATLLGAIGGSPLTGGLAVQPAAPQLSASASPFDLGSQPLGTMGPERTVTITLIGGDA
ncbi:MAG TPA: DUF4394 domain-containing protein, partial [Solirubrobacteraceae bacterium]|nr:DUF4394 domain-containing protein [Solirubrobacteraceae bacterium]